MAEYEAVDRLMELATEKRADRIADAAPAVRSSTEAGTEGKPGKLAMLPAARLPVVEAAPSGPTMVPSGPSSSARGRQLFDAIRPLLPAVARALRMVDHGAVQAVARLLPLLSEGAPRAPQKEAATPAQEQAFRAVENLLNSQQANRRDVEAMKLQVASLEEELGRSRTQLERLAAEQSARDIESRSLADRVHLLSAATIILVMLNVAQMILMVVLLHK